MTHVWLPLTARILLVVEKPMLCSRGQQRGRRALPASEDYCLMSTQACKHGTMHLIAGSCHLFMSRRHSHHDDSPPRDDYREASPARQRERSASPVRCVDDHMLSELCAGCACSSLHFSPYLLA